MSIIPRSQTPFMLMEAKDEQQILAAIEGQVVTEFVYKVEGKTGLSLTGVNHMCFKMGHIKVDPSSARIEYDERDDEYTAYIVAINEKYELSAMGVSTQPRMMEIHVKDSKGRWVKNEDGSYKMATQRDRFAKTKAMSKAERNAKRKIIPEAILKAYLDYFMALKEGKSVESPSFDTVDLDKPSTAVKPTNTPRQVSSDIRTTEAEPESVEQPPQPDPKNGIPVFRSGAGEVVATVGVEGVKDYLIGAVKHEEFDSDNFEITEEDGAFEIKNKEWIKSKNDWQEINEAIRDLGGKWVVDKEDNKNNHWYIPKAKEPEVNESFEEFRDKVVPQPVEESSEGVVSSIEELEDILNRRIMGAEEMVTVTQDGRGFTVEPDRIIEPDIIEVIDYIIEELGGSKHKTQRGQQYEWLIPYKEAED